MFEWIRSKPKKEEPAIGVFEYEDENGVLRTEGGIEDADDADTPEDEFDNDSEDAEDTFTAREDEDGDADEDAGNEDGHDAEDEGVDDGEE